VDDDSTVRDSLSDVLVSEGYVLIPAENGQPAAPTGPGVPGPELIGPGLPGRPWSVTVASGLLLAAILSEVAGTLALRLSDGFSRLVPSVVVVVGYVVAFGIMAEVLRRGMAVGVAYGIWSAIGVALIAIIGAVFLGDRLTWIQAVGIGLVILGVAALEFGRA